MGYDMRTVVAEPGEREAVQEAREAFYAACRERDAISDKESQDFKDAQAEVEVRYGEMDVADKSYFRLNIWGMGAALEYMHRFGMLSEGDHPAWPEHEEFGLSDKEWEAAEEQYYDADEDLDAVTSANGRKFIEAHQAVLSASGDTPGIPFWKLCSNDGWHVTPEECQAALDAYEAAGKPEVEKEHREWWAEWLDYLAYSTTHGGFRVH